MPLPLLGTHCERVWKRVYRAWLSYSQLSRWGNAYQVIPERFCRFYVKIVSNHNYLLQVIEALPAALIGGIYWGLAQVDDGQVRDMVSTEQTFALFFQINNNCRWWVLDGTLFMRIRSELWKLTLSINLRRRICMANSSRCNNRK